MKCSFFHNEPSCHNFFQNLFLLEKSDYIIVINLFHNLSLFPNRYARPLWKGQSDVIVYLTLLHIGINMVNIYGWVLLLTDRIGVWQRCTLATAKRGEKHYLIINPPLLHKTSSHWPTTSLLLPVISPSSTLDEKEWEKVSCFSV